MRPIGKNSPSVTAVRSSAGASKLRLVLASTLLLTLTLAASCGDDFSVRPAPSMGGAAGAGSGGGGAGTGGVSNACTAECADETPFCLEGECVECREDDECVDGVCDEKTHSCVECTEPAHCAEQRKPFCEANQCEGCTTAADCEGLGLSQCGPGGLCVACLTEADCGNRVCDPETHACTTLPARALNACEECEHDAQCQKGQVCVTMAFAKPAPGVVGQFCLWEKATTGIDAPNGVCGTFPPYAATATVTSVDGVATAVCSLATTTCPALLHYRTAVPDCTAAGDNEACGAPGFDDGACRLDGDALPKCTYPCLGPQDCKPGATCPATGAQYCSL